MVELLGMLVAAGMRIGELQDTLAGAGLVVIELLGILAEFETEVCELIGMPDSAGIVDIFRLLNGLHVLH